MGQQVADGHGALAGRGQDLRVATGFIDPQVTPAGDIFGYRIIKQEAALLVQLHQRY